METGRSYQFRGTLSEAQHRRLQWLSSRKLILGSGVFLFALVVMNILSGVGQTAQQSPTIRVARLAPLLLLVPAIFLAARWRINRQYRANAALRGEVTGAVTESGVEFKTEVCQARYRWDQFMSATLSTDMVLIFTSPRAVLYLPRTFFSSPESWAGMVDLIRQRAPNAK